MSYPTYMQQYPSTSQQQSYSNTRQPSQSTRMISPSSSQAYYQSTSEYSTSPVSDQYSPASQSSQEAPSYVYPCLFQDCNHKSGRKADLERHVQVIHMRDCLPLVDCESPGCHRKGKYGFTRKDKMVDHMRDVHKADIAKRPAGGWRSSGISR